MERVDDMIEQLSKMLTFSSTHQAYIADVLATSVNHYGQNLLGLAIFGSYARKENTKLSDLDLLLILQDAPCRRERLNDFIAHIEMKHEPLAQQLYEDEAVLCELSPYILTESEALKFQTIYSDMVDHHIILLDPQHLLKRILEATRNLLLRVDARKVRRNNTWEWQFGRFLGGEAL
jgi:predicted nucleotidyltransferase